jgi:eukaryotic-like serine/threonine-protein kinase
MPGEKKPASADETQLAPVAATPATDPTLTPPAGALPTPSPSTQGASGTAGYSGIGLIGREIGPYRIVAELGAGGMGAVYLADQFQPIRRQVALKLIHTGMESTDLLARFRSERDLLARMNHPNIAQVLDVGQSEDGRLYFAMEYVPGVPLSEFCDRRGLDVEHRLALFLQVCEGVQHAHQKGVIHRDIKPGNLLVADYHGRHLVKVIDFGIAKSMDDFGRLEPGTTRAGVPIGTPAYMSPEQARGDPNAVDTRTDVYSLGGVLYKLLTDEAPVTEDVISRSTDVGLARALQDAVIEAPSQRVTRMAPQADSEWRRRMANDPVTHARSLRGDLDWIALKALEQDRDRRYASVSELAADVQRFLHGEAVLASPPSRIYRARKFVARHRVFVTAAAAVLLALVAGVVGTTWMALEAQSQRLLAEAAQAQAEAERDRAEAERNRAQAVSGFLEEMIAAPDPWKLDGVGVDARNVRLIDALERAAERLERLVQDDRELRGEIGGLLGRTLRRLGLAGAASARLEAAVADLQASPGKALAEARIDLLLTLGERGDSRRVAAELDGVLALAESSPGTSIELIEELRRFQVEFAAQLGDLAEAELLGRQNLERAVASHGETSVEVSGARAALAEVLGERGQWEESEALISLARDDETRRLGPAHPRVLQLRFREANLLFRKGDYSAAEALFHSLGDTAEQVLGPDHASTLIFKANVATAMDNAGRRAEATALLREMIPRLESALGDNHHETLTFRSNLALSLRAQQRIEEAEREMEDVHRRRQRVLGEQHPETIRTLMFLAVLARDRKDLARAEVLLGQAAALYARINGPDHPETLVMENNHLSVMRERGENERALRGYAQLWPRAERSLPEGHWHRAVIRGNFGRSLYQAGRFEEAEIHVLGAYRAIAEQFDEADPRRVSAAAQVEELYTLWNRPERIAEILPARR